MTLRDNEGSTPLHVAVKSSESVESSRVVRYLLLNGAETDLKDDKDRTPLDLLADIQS